MSAGAGQCREWEEKLGMGRKHQWVVRELGSGCLLHLSAQQRKAERAVRRGRAGREKWNWSRRWLLAQMLPTAPKHLCYLLPYCSGGFHLVLVCNSQPFCRCRAPTVSWNAHAIPRPSSEVCMCPFLFSTAHRASSSHADQAWCPCSNQHSVCWIVCFWFSSISFGTVTASIRSSAGKEAGRRTWKRRRGQR